MASECFLHCSEKVETLLKLTIKQFETSKLYANQWTKCPENALSKVASNRLSFTEYNDEFVVHQSCYSKFCNKLLLERALSKSHRADEVSIDDDF